MRSDSSRKRFLAAAPQFTVPDVVRTAEYYRDILGFEIKGYFGEPPVFTIVGRDGVELYCNKSADERQAPLTERAAVGYDAYIHVAGVNALAGELHARGADIIEGPIDRTYKQRELVIRDCNGLVLALGEDSRGAT